MVKITPKHKSRFYIFWLEICKVFTNDFSRQSVNKTSGIIFDKRRGPKIIMHIMQTYTFSCFNISPRTISDSSCICFQIHITFAIVKTAEKLERGILMNRVTILTGFNYGINLICGNSNK